jgi:hypothetical protein
VTASALLDLVSEPWLRNLADCCAETRAAVLFALTFDGRIACTPEDCDDRTIVARVNEHQRRNKGFGPALGPDATDHADRCFRERGYQVTRVRTDWQLTPPDAELQRQLIDGWAQAVIELASMDSAVVEGWRRRRHAHIDANQSSIMVGHEDLLGIIETENL